MPERKKEYTLSSTGCFAELTKAAEFAASYASGALSSPEGAMIIHSQIMTKQKRDLV